MYTPFTYFFMGVGLREKNVCLKNYDVHVYTAQYIKLNHNYKCMGAALGKETTAPEVLPRAIPGQIIIKSVMAADPGEGAAAPWF